MSKKINSPLLWDLEMLYKNRVVCGVDEAGRGPLVGRVYAAAVILPYEMRENPIILALNDSKKLTEKKRDFLASGIKEIATAWSVAWSEVEEIETLNILEASQLAMRRAISGLQIQAEVALVDGNICRNFPIEARAVVGGDGISPSIAAASVLAKTERDKWCVEVLDKEYPQYNFAKHKGYGTREHYEALEKYGPCPEHRMSFLKKFYER